MMISLPLFLAQLFNVEEPSETEIRIYRDGPTDHVITLYYQTIDGTANSVQGDYTRVTAQSVTFGQGQQEIIIYVRVLDDTLAEGPETFYLEVYDIQGW